MAKWSQDENMCQSTFSFAGCIQLRNILCVQLLLHGDKNIEVLGEKVHMNHQDASLSFPDLAFIVN